MGSTSLNLTENEIRCLLSATESELEELLLTMSPEETEQIIQAMIEADSPPVEAVPVERIGLYAFGQEAWRVLRPGEEFIPGDHIEVLCAHLEHATETPNYNLAVMMPPNCGKSIWSTVIWPAWVWGPRGWPAARFLFATYSQDRSRDDSGKFDRLIESEWYQKQWPILLTSDAVNYFENTSGGQRKATGVGGIGTGEHPHFVCVDDANKAEDKPIEFKNSVSWWKGQMSSRGIVASIGSRRIAMGQRLTMADVPGACIDMGYDIVCFPMWAWEPPTLQEIEKQVWRPKPTAIGWVDTRSPGELLWPEGIPEAKARELETTLGPMRAAAQLQQKPIRTLVNGMFPRVMVAKRMLDWANIPWGEIVATGRYWDKAGGESVEADYTAGVCMGLWLKKSPAEGVKPEKQLIVFNVVRGRWNPFDRNVIIRQTAEADLKLYGPRHQLWIESEARGGSGIESKQQSQRELTDLGVRFDAPTTAKILRANGFSSAWYGGLVYVVVGTWNSFYLDELEIFDGEDHSGEDIHDDCVDASSGMANKLLAVSTTRAAPPTGRKSKAR